MPSVYCASRRTASVVLLIGLGPVAGCQSSAAAQPAAGELGPDAGDAAAEAAAEAATEASPDAGEHDANVATDSGVSVLQHHRSAMRDGRYVDAAMTHAAVGGLHRIAAFDGSITGPTYAQPLYMEDGPSGRPAIFVATEHNEVDAIDAETGALLWTKSMGTPVPKSSLPCGNIDPLGITGTPIIDAPSRSLFLDAMTTPDGGVTKKHLIFRLSVDDGEIATGWPVDVNTALSGASPPFDSEVQNQRGGLALLNGTVYVPYGGHWGDCGDYHGWLVGVPLAHPEAPVAWVTPARGGGSWAPGGVASDGTALYISTGTTFGASTWGGGEAILRFAPGPSFDGSPDAYFAPSNWKALDDGDIDIGGSGPVLFDVPGASPSSLAIALGKNGVGYLLDRNHLGGVGIGDGTSGEGLFSARVSQGPIINAAAAYATAQGVYVVFKGDGASCPAGQAGDLTALRVSATSPPAFAVAWCADQRGEGSPIATTSTQGGADPIVWGLGAEGDGRLRGFDGDTGAVLFDGGAQADHLPDLRRFISPIVAKGRIYVAGDARVVAFGL